MTGPGDNAAKSSALFAWDGVSFLVPANWNLAGYSFRKSVVRVEFEDEYSLRMEVEWIRPRKALEMDSIHKRYGKSARRIARIAEKSSECPNLPSGWSASLYELPEERRLLTAYYLAHESSLFGFFRIHFGPEDAERHRDILKLLTSSFRVHEGPVVPWATYDVSFELPADFKLAATSLQAGKKALIFHWRLRRFYIWFFSLATILLKGQMLEEWAAAFLNAYKGIKGPRFIPGIEGGIEAKRLWRHRLGHFEEIGRLCFRYHARAIHDREKDRVVLWVFNYRTSEDLSIIPASLTETRTS